MNADSSCQIITVVVFCRNAVGTIGRALSSVTDQHFRNCELLVLDGGSTDGTADVIRRHEENITYWRTSADGGPVDAVNEGLRRATGDVICLLAADDWLEPGSLDAVWKKFSADPTLEVLSCGTRYVRMDDDGTMQVEAVFDTPDSLEFRLKTILEQPLTGGRFIRRRVYERLGGYNPGYKLSDYDFLIRACLCGVRSKVLTRMTYTYLRHAKSATLGNEPGNILTMLRETALITARHLQEVGVQSRDRRVLLDRHGLSSAHGAWRFLRDGRFASAAEVTLGAFRTDRWWPLHALRLLLSKLLTRQARHSLR